MARPSLVPPILAGQNYSLTQRVVFLGQHCQFSMYFNAASAINRGNTVAEENDIFSYWNVTVMPLLRASLSVGTTIDVVRIFSLTWPDVATGIFATGNPLGTFAGAPLPPQIALVLSKATDLRGKSGRGRMYLCGLSDGGMANGEPTVAQLLAANNLANQLKLSFIGGGTGVTFKPTVVSLKQYKLASEAGVPPVPVPPPILGVRGGIITTVIADSIYNTQRKRTFGRGE